VARIIAKGRPADLRRIKTRAISDVRSLLPNQELASRARRPSPHPANRESISREFHALVTPALGIQYNGRIHNFNSERHEVECGGLPPRSVREQAHALQRRARLPAGPLRGSALAHHSFRGIRSAENPCGHQRHARSYRPGALSPLRERDVGPRRIVCDLLRDLGKVEGFWESRVANTNLRVEIDLFDAS
jgi:hypothetical protein